MSRRVVVLYNGPNRVMLVLDWVFLVCAALAVGLPLIAGQPPTWLTVINAALVAPIANELIRSYRVKAYFGEAVSSIVMSKIETPSASDLERMYER